MSSSIGETVIDAIVKGGLFTTEGPPQLVVWSANAAEQIEELVLNEMMERRWYLLYSGSSADGRGHPSYVGRTIHESIAMEHWKTCTSPYSNGKVVIVDDNKETEITGQMGWRTYAKKDRTK